jgi:ribonuclease HII
MGSPINLGEHFLKEWEMDNIFRSLADYDESFREQGYINILGIDEVGRGSLAGPITFAGALISKTPKKFVINDSKKLTPKKREKSFEFINGNIKCYLKHCNHEDIDEYGLTKVTDIAINHILDSFSNHSIDIVLLDQMPIIQKPEIPYRLIVKGDSTSLAIACASVFAKVSRDNLMKDFYHAELPLYGFDMHKGYGTKKHYEAISQYGLSRIHRKSFNI